MSRFTTISASLRRYGRIRRKYWNRQKLILRGERQTKVLEGIAECSPEETYIIGNRLDNDIEPVAKLGMNTINQILKYL